MVLQGIKYDLRKISLNPTSTTYTAWNSFVLLLISYNVAKARDHLSALVSARGFLSGVG